MSEARNSEVENEIEIEIVDDTPSRDRGRPLAPEKTDSDDDISVSDDEVSRYRAEVQKRFKELSFKAHSERRTKEQAIREREEAERLTKALYDENRRLRDLAGSNEKLMVDQAKQRAETQIDVIKRDAKEALEAGETERFVNAQEKLHRAVSEHERYLSYRPQPQEEDTRGQNNGPAMEERPRQQDVRPPEPDELGKAFMKRNPWFDADGDLEHEMTGYAFTMHDKLVRRMGVDPRSDEYYSEIEKAVRHRFSEYFKDHNSQKSVRDATTSAPTVVASATRSSRTTSTARLTPSMVKLAKRLGLTNEQYATDYVKAYGNG